MSTLSGLYTQLYPPKPTLTETNLPDQADKVFIVTGGNNGVGFEVVKILYSKGARVYLAARSEAKAKEAIKNIKSTISSPSGEIKFLHIDLADLTTIKKAADEFGAQEEKLDVLWNNAGVAAMPVDQRTPQGCEMHMGTNCVGPFLFTKLLLPKLKAAAKTRPKDAVRIIWTSSVATDANSPKGGVSIAELSVPSSDPVRNYAASKAGNWLLATEFARKVSGDGIVSIAQNPGNLKTTIWSTAPTWTRIMMSPTLSPVKYGAYTEIWAGLSTEVTVTDGVNGRYVIPWGRFFVVKRKDILEALKPKEEGGEYSGRAGDFWTWCDEQTMKFT